jgi:hypothetical protein
MFLDTEIRPPMIAPFTAPLKLDYRIRDRRAPDGSRDAVVSLTPAAPTIAAERAVRTSIATPIRRPT